MAGPELVADLRIVLRALVDVFDQQRDRRARRDLLRHALVLNTPERIFTVSGSWRWLTNFDWPGRRRSRSAWMSACVSAMPGGQPSITQPIAGPWLSPKVVTR